LGIEVDGISHNDKDAYDLSREKKLNKLGITILRFDGKTVLNNTDGVMREIVNWIEDYEKTHP
jgi:very-short-patch-repair endonuclease